MSIIPKPISPPENASTPPHSSSTPSVGGAENSDRAGDSAGSSERERLIKTAAETTAGYCETASNIDQDGMGSSVAESHPQAGNCERTEANQEGKDTTVAMDVEPSECEGIPNSDGASEGEEQEEQGVAGSAGTIWKQPDIVSVYPHTCTVGWVLSKHIAFPGFEGKLHILTRMVSI